MMWRVQLFKLNYDDRERDAVATVIQGGWLTMGEKVDEFETAFANFLGKPRVVCTAVSSGTAALHLALLALGIGSGDEVIIPALTFVADANVVRVVGASPVLADCSALDDWNCDGESIEACITPRTKAVIIVHYAGYPCNMDVITAVCSRHRLPLIEDVAHAPGASHQGQFCGTFGDIACFSFFSNKNLAIGEGGLVATRDAKLHQRLRYLRSHGMSTLTLDRHQGRAITYDVLQPGLNCRMDEIHAALGLVQLLKLPEANQRRGELTDRYRRQLAGSGVDVPFFNLAYGSSAYHILPVLLPANVDRFRVINALKGYGIQTSIHYPAFWEFTAYHDHFRPQDTPLASAIIPRQLTLPLYPSMNDADVDYVVASLLAALSAEYDGSL